MTTPSQADVGDRNGDVGSGRPLHVWMPTIRGHSGGDVFVERLAEGLRERGVKVTVDWFDQRFEFMPSLLSSRKAPPDVDVIHANGLVGYVFRSCRLPLVVTEHHLVVDPGYRPYKTTLQHVYHRLVTGRASLRSIRVADAVAVHSRFVAATVRAAVPGCSPMVVPLWVDLDRFTPGDFTDGRDRPLRLLFVGNASRRKGFDVVIELAHRLGPGVEISCTGGLRGKACGDLPDNIRYLGRLTSEELVAAYHICDAALVPSRYEGFGYAALEALACARPVLGFACGSIEEIVEDRRSGLLYRVDDIDGLEAGARELAARPDWRRELGLAGRARAEQSFDPGIGIGGYHDIYLTLRRSW